MKDNNVEEISEYYKAYDKRYKQVYEYITENKISRNDKILDLGCGEGRDSIFLLKKGYNVLTVDYSKTVIDKCNYLTENKFQENFKQFDLIKDRIDSRFKFIYSIAVLHMFVLEEHRKKYFDFIYEHLEENGKALICVLGDGNTEKTSDITEAFKDIDRTVMNNNTTIKVATTSCRIVNWKTLENEITNSNLKIEKKWISNQIPEFSSSMCAVVSKNKTTSSF